MMATLEEPGARDIGVPETVIFAPGFSVSPAITNCDAESAV